MDMSFLHLKMHLKIFIWLHQVLVEAHEIFLLQYTEFLAVASGLSSCSMWASSLACGVLVPRPEMEPTSLAFEGGFVASTLPGKSLEYALLKLVVPFASFIHQYVYQSNIIF